MINIQHIKTLLGINASDKSKDNLLLLLTDQSLSDCKTYTHNDDIPDSIVYQLVVYRYNLLGSEGINSESFGGVNYNYNSDIPTFLLNQLKSCRKAIFK